MRDFHHDLTELNYLLQRADVLRRWTRGLAYSVDGATRVEFKAEIAIRADAHVRPAGTDLEIAEVELNLVVSDDGAITSCSAQVVIDGLASDGGAVRRFALHFDRHPDGQASTELHATYHWQVGGSQLDDMELGNALFLEGPRFPSHPIDPVLLVDFVLGHFNGAKRSELLTQHYVRYRRLLHGVQSCFVAPFFAAISAALAAENFEPTGLWPALCGPSSP
ncbi:MAG: hypothetical protein U1E62_21635 [Alsobacter sp.]